MRQQETSGKIRPWFSVFPLHWNHIYAGLSPDSLEKLLRAKVGLLGYSLMLPQIKQLSPCAFFVKSTQHGPLCQFWLLVTPKTLIFELDMAGEKIGSGGFSRKEDDQVQTKSVIQAARKVKTRLISTNQPALSSKWAISCKQLAEVFKQK